MPNNKYNDYISTINYSSILEIYFPKVKNKVYNISFQKSTLCSLTFVAVIIPYSFFKIQNFKPLDSLVTNGWLWHKMLCITPVLAMDLISEEACNIRNGWINFMHISETMWLNDILYRFSSWVPLAWLPTLTGLAFFAVPWWDSVPWNEIDMNAILSQIMNWTLFAETFHPGY